MRKVVTGARDREEEGEGEILRRPKEMNRTMRPKGGEFNKERVEVNLGGKQMK